MVRILVLLYLCVSIVLTAEATEQYSIQTGRSCAYCHKDPSGGGELTTQGEAFGQTLKEKGFYRPLSPVQRVIRFIIGFVHTITGIIWFGTILYVHVLLKPAYAARGLPRGELMLGWISIIIMAITGTLLTIARVPSLKMMFHSRFGVLLSIKILLFILMVISAAVVTFVIGPRLKTKRPSTRKESEAGGLTPEELAQFDGREGRAAYIAYKGVVYDVTASKLWKNGSHARKHLAGYDLTDAIGKAPHGEDRVLRMPVVGRLVESSSSQKAPFPIRLFYLLAYSNLILVFLIVFVISLWRWW